MSLYVTKHSIPQETRSLVSKRYHTITKAVNKEFWDSDSDTANSLYVGSYGRGTAIDTSDLDVLVSLPQDQFDYFNNLKGNSQSRLLQAVRSAILSTYPKTDVSADGQVVDVVFSDGMKFEILPAFESTYRGFSLGSYTYADTNNGGKWRSTFPKVEQDAMKKKNDESNGLLFDTCKHMRYIRDNYFSSCHLSGIVIDSFVFKAIGSWHWTPEGQTSSTPAGTYEKKLLDEFNIFFKWSDNIATPGSNQNISFIESRDTLGKVLNFMA